VPPHGYIYYIITTKISKGVRKCTTKSKGIGFMTDSTKDYLRNDRMLRALIAKA